MEQKLEEIGSKEWIQQLRNKERCGRQSIHRDRLHRPSQESHRPADKELRYNLPSEVKERRKAYALSQRLSSQLGRRENNKAALCSRNEAGKRAAMSLHERKLTEAQSGHVSRSISELPAIRVPIPAMVGLSPAVDPLWIINTRKPHARLKRNEIKITPPLEFTQIIHQDRLRVGLDWGYAQEPFEHSHHPRDQTRRRRRTGNMNRNVAVAPVAVGLLARDFQNFVRDKERQNLIRQWNHIQRAVEFEDEIANVVSGPRRNML